MRAVSPRIVGFALAALLCFLVVPLVSSGCSFREGESTTSSPTVTTPRPSSTTDSTETTSSTHASTTLTTDGGSGTLSGKEYERLPVTNKVVALTFDAAYDPAPLTDILRALRQSGVRGTFFLTGEFIEDFPEATREIVKAGYPIGNHSYSHPDFTTLSLSAMRRQLERTATLVVKAGASDPRPLFRAPYGARNARVLSLLAQEGYVSVYWTIDTLDWKTGRTAEQIRKTVLSHLRPGAIVLMHVGSRQTASILAALIDDIRAAGYEFTTVRDVLGVALPNPRWASAACLRPAGSLVCARPNRCCIVR